MIGCRRTGIFRQFWCKCNIQQNLEKFWQCQLNMNICISYTRDFIPRYIPNKNSYISHQKKCTKITIAALFVIVPNWKQSKSLSIIKWKIQLWNNHTMNYYIAEKNSGDHSCTLSLELTEDVALINGLNQNRRRYRFWVNKDPTQ